jgi:hypothetical protein
VIWVLFAILAVVAVSSEEPQIKKSEVVQKQKTIIAQKAKPLYPDEVLDTIEKLKEPGMSKVDKYTFFEQRLIGLKPTEKEMLKHLEIVKAAYSKVTFDGVQKIDDETILKQIYSARMVDVYYATDEVSNPTGLFAFNYIQIAKDAYRGILERENYDINKMTMDNHFNNMK